jgi:hypothetical protein
MVITVVLLYAVILYLVENYEMKRSNSEVDLLFRNTEGNSAIL